jgi:hypothetical protein
MEKRAQALNYQPVQAKQVQFIIVPGYIAPQPANLCGGSFLLQPSAPTIRPEYTQSLLNWFDQRLHTPISVEHVGISQ